jgi:hypothetical protein
VSRNDLMIFALGMMAAAGGLVAIATFLEFGREVRRSRREDRADRDDS